MSDERNPYTPMSAPSAARPGSANADPRGTLGRGIKHFFICVIGGSIATFVLVLVLSIALTELSVPRANEITEVLPLLVTVLPWLLAIGLCIRHAIKGRTRTALGMVVAVGILIALLVLLVAACFGLISVMNINFG